MNQTSSKMMLALLIISMLSFTLHVRPANSQPSTIIVPDNYSTIQEAINNANPGSTIFVRNGTYPENVIVNKTVTLLGEDKYATIIDGKYAGTVIHVKAKNVTICNFTIQHSSLVFHYEYGYSGIQIYHTSGANITHNIIKDNYVGIFLDHSSKNVLLANNAKNNIYNFAVRGESFSHFNSYVEASNTVDGKAICYLVGAENIIYNAQFNIGNVYLINCRNVTIRNLTTTRNYCGVFLWNTTNSKIENITAWSNYEAGIWLERSNNNILRRNSVSGHVWHGIRLVNSHNNVIDKNDASNNWNEGIYVYDSDHNQIISNTITNNNNGIYLLSSNDTYILGNNIARNRDMGIALYSPCATIIRNNIEENDNGIVLSECDNVIYHNNFIRNSKQVLLINPYKNTWDNGYPSGGNYWSDYIGNDTHSGPSQIETGSDGIGDTPYIIKASNNIDHYPLMEPYPTTIINAKIDIYPTTLNLKSKGKWIIAFIKLPAGYKARDINLSTIKLNNTTIKIEKLCSSSSKLILLLDRQAVINLILRNYQPKKRFSKITLTITGKLKDGTAFEGNDTIKIITPRPRHARNTINCFFHHIVQ